MRTLRQALPEHWRTMLGAEIPHAMGWEATSACAAEILKVVRAADQLTAVATDVATDINGAVILQCRIFVDG